MLLLDLTRLLLTLFRYSSNYIAVSQAVVRVLSVIKHEMAATNELAEQLPAGAAQQQAGLPATAIDNTLGKILLYVFWQCSVAIVHLTGLRS